MPLLALVGALAIGLSLGLLGSGGSILTVPVLTYVLGQPEKVAIAGSLAIVGAISLVASVPYARRGQVDLRSLAFFGVPGMGGAYLGAALSRFASGGVQLGAFSLLMLVAAALMLRPAKHIEPPASSEAVQSGGRPIGWIALEGSLVGIVTGFVGVGGGFLIVPALVLLGGLSMQRAIGTSLLIIALKSGVGLVEYLRVLRELELALDWRLIGVFATVGILGSFAGSRAGRVLPQATLRRAFAVFLIAIGAWILARNLPEVVSTGAAAVAAR